MLHLTVAMVENNNTQLNNYYSIHNPIRRLVWIMKCLTVSKYVQKGSSERSVCLKDRRPCPDWFKTKGREGFSKMEDRR